MQKLSGNLWSGNITTVWSMLSKVSAKFSLVKFLNQVIELLLSRFHLYQCLQPPVRKSHAEPMPKPWGFWHRFSNKITGQFWTVPRMPQTQLLRATCAIFLLNVAQGRRKSRKKSFCTCHMLYTRDSWTTPSAHTSAPTTWELDPLQ